MDGSFFPPVERVKYYDNGVAKDVKKLPKPVEERFQEFLCDLRDGQVPKTGKNISQVSGVKKCRLSDQIRIAFTLQENTVTILSVGNHDEMDQFLDTIRRL